MYVQIEKITADRREAEFFEGYMWDYEQETLQAYKGFVRDTCLCPIRHKHVSRTNFFFSVHDRHPAVPP